ncbi:MAG: carboxypeptidase regulatory-like domain-containing protein, partial [Gemmatimonadaceae bacterium]
MRRFAVWTRALRALATTIAMLVCRVSLVAAQATQTTPVANGSIGGLVTSATGLPLLGVNISLTGEEGGTVSDSAGRFVLREIKPGGHTLLLRRIGYHSVER